MQKFEFLNQNSIFWGRKNFTPSRSGWHCAQRFDLPLHLQRLTRLQWPAKGPFPERFMVMAIRTERLPVVRIPEQTRIPFVRNAMISYRRGGHAVWMAPIRISAQRMRLEKPPRSLLPSIPIPTLRSRSTPRLRRLLRLAIPTEPTLREPSTPRRSTWTLHRVRHKNVPNLLFFMFDTNMFVLIYSRSHQAAPTARRTK